MTASPMVRAVLEEVAQHVGRLGHSLAPATIDLRSLPLSAEDLEALEDRLGRGEVEIQLDVAGRSDVWETGYAGVWWVRHLGVDGSVVTELLEITDVPRVVRAHRDDIEAAARRLGDELAQTTTEGA